RIRGNGATPLPESVSRALRETRELVAAGRVPEAYAAVDRYPPDVRVVVRPFVTHFSGAKTVIGTARATMEFLRTITQGSDVLVAGQIALDGEAYGIRSTIGVPFVVGNQGVDRVFELPLSDEERESLCDSAARVQQKNARFL
ncbi:lactate dehydrogenase, partial [Candidatus Bipolaricaulota bacterium]|nr:lactate dehydrogenase [Candidatus Bipolaricaulota bacterium]